MNEHNHSDHKGRELRERSSSARNTKTSRGYKNSDYFGSNIKSEHPQLTSKQSKEYPKA
jgi:hypothetical protein